MKEGDYRSRALCFSSVLALPFAGFLVTHRYPFYRIESLAALLILLAVAALAALLFRGIWFRWTLALLCTLVAAAPLQRELVPLVRLPLSVAFALTALALCLLVWKAGPRFAQLVLVFSSGMFAAHVVRSVPDGPLLAASQPRAIVAGHILHVVLDEHMSPAGLPDEIPACRRAAAAIRDTFSTRGFVLHDNAYSNYPTTFDSLGSALNRRLLHHRREMLTPSSPDARGVYHLRTGPLWQAARQRGLQVRLVEYQGIDFLDGEPGTVVPYAGSLSAVSRMPGSWTGRFRLLVSHYQASDPITAACKGFFPFRFGLRMLFPLWTESVWPGRLLDEIESADRPTYFFAHILSPHGPYIYRAGGALREAREWLHDQDYRRLSSAEYTERYARYAEQIEHTQSQLRWLLDSLRSRGRLDRMTVVIHGDHGSRILQARPETAQLAIDGPTGVDRFDYTGAPPRQDLRDRFSILFAVRRPGGLAPASDDRPSSLLRLLSGVLPGDPPAESPANDSIFLFSKEGRPHELTWGD